MTLLTMYLLDLCVIAFLFLMWGGGYVMTVAYLQAKGHTLTTTKGGTPSPGEKGGTPSRIKA